MNFLKTDKELKASKEFDVRFSEVDSMGVVWHGSYMLYFEDAREEFGRQFHLEYMHMSSQGFYAPLVDMEFHYRRPLLYEKRYRIDITYRPTLSAKIVFDYEIHDAETNDLMATGRSVQVFMDKDYQLVWTSPQFYEEWKKMWGFSQETMLSAGPEESHRAECQ